MKFGLKIFTPLLLAAALVMPSTPALAATTTVASPAGVRILAAQDAGGAVGTQTCESKIFTVDSLADSPVLADKRWQDAASGLHSRTDNTKVAGFDTGFNGKAMSRDMAGGLMNGGTAIWGWTTSLVTGSVSFCTPQAVFVSVDNAAGKIGSMITEGANGLGGFFLAITLIASFFVAYRRKSFPVKDIVSKIIALGLLAVMVSGALDSKEQGGVYKPGFMSPGYIATGLTNSINDLAQGPANLLAKGLIEAPEKSGSKDWCSAYVGAMHNAYNAENGYISGSQIPIALGEMWASAGGKTWSDSQYGNSGDGSQYANGSWCMHLEMRRDQPSWNGEVYMGGLFGGSGKEEYNSPILKQMWGEKSKAYTSSRAAFANQSLAFHAKSVEDVDKSVIAWASCQIDNPTGSKDKNLLEAGSWKVRAGVGENVKPEHCAAWYSGEDKKLAEFNWPTGVEAIQKHAASNKASTQFVKYVMYLHGEQNMASMTGAFTYLISSLILLVIYGVMSVGVYVAQIALVFVSIALVLALIHWAVPFTRGGLKNLAKVFKALLGLSLVSLAVVGLFTFVALLTRIVQSLGEGMGSSTFQAIWTGLSPAIAVLVLHLMFTKVLKKPSPFSLSGATAWTNTLSGSGGAAGLGGLASMTGRIDSRVSSARNDLLERVPGVSRGMDAMHRAGITKAGSRRGAQTAADPEKRAAKAAVTAMQQAGVVAQGARAGASTGVDLGQNTVDGALGGAQNGARRGAGMDDGLNHSADGDMVNALMNGADVDEKGAVVQGQAADPNADLDVLKLREGQSPDDIVKDAKTADQRIEAQIANLELGKIDREESRAGHLQMSDPKQMQVGQHLLANVHHTGVDNSMLEEVAVGGKQKEVAAKVAKLEREQASKWAKEAALSEKSHRKDQIRQGINPETGEEFTAREIPSMKNRAKDLLAAQMNDFKKRPVRTIAKNAAIGATASVALAAVAPGALLAAPLAMLAPTAVNAASKRVNSVRKAVAQRRDARSTEGQDALVSRYREHLRNEDKETQAQIQQLRQRQGIVQAHRTAAEQASTSQREQAKEQLKQSEADRMTANMANGALAAQASARSDRPASRRHLANSKGADNEQQVVDHRTSQRARQGGGRRDSLRHPEQHDRPQPQAKPQATERPEPQAKPQRAGNQRPLAQQDRPQPQAKPQATERPEPQAKPQRAGNQRPLAQQDRPQPQAKPQATERPEPQAKPQRAGNQRPLAQQDRPQPQARPQATERPEPQAKPQRAGSRPAARDLGTGPASRPTQRPNK